MNSNDRNNFIVSQNYSGLRADVVFSKVLSNLTRSQIRKYIKENCIKINGESFKPSKILSGGELVQLSIPDPEPIEALPEEIDLEFIYEDSDIAVVNKRAGMVVHPGAGVKTGTLVNALLFSCKDLSGIGGKIRPGIVHRLDKETSGVMVVAKNDFSHQNLVDQFKNRDVKKEYLALVRGEFKNKNGVFESSIGRDIINRIKISSNTKSGRQSLTHWEVVEEFTVATLIKAIPKTGRTHQIRVHFAENNHPLLGDKLYSRKNLDKKFKSLNSLINRHMLHSLKIGFSHPRTNSFVEFTAPIPNDMKKIIKVLKERNS